MKLLITGARGFIGSAFVRMWAEQATGSLVDSQRQVPPFTWWDEITSLVAFSRPSQVWTEQRLRTLPVQRAIDQGKLKMVHGDLLADVSGLAEGCDAIVHFAAKTFVDHSIRDPGPFMDSNTTGSARLLAEAHRQGVRTYVQISTDEVYGQILKGAYTEQAAWNPRNPYAASKAAADALAIAYHHTFGMQTIITRTENNYGPWQHPQKVLPVFVGKAMRDEPLPVYGDGGHIRQWLHVHDHCAAVMHLLHQAWHENLPGGEVWHVAGCEELTNLELARRVLEYCGKPHTQVKHIDDHNIRPGHDRRYALDCGKMNGIGWNAQVGLDEGLRECVKWYADRRWWVE